MARTIRTPDPWQRPEAYRAYWSVSRAQRRENAADRARTAKGLNSMAVYVLVVYITLWVLVSKVAKERTEVIDNLVAQELKFAKSQREPALPLQVCCSSRAFKDKQ